MNIVAGKTALVLIEPQNDFLKPGGTMYEFIKEQLKKRDVIQKLVDLTNKLRGKIKIIYVPFHHFEPGFPELKPNGPAVEGLRGLEMDMSGWGTKGAWVKGTPGPEIIDELKPQPGDIIVEGKKTLDAFHSTALDWDWDRLRLDC